MTTRGREWLARFRFRVNMDRNLDEFQRHATYRQLADFPFEVRRKRYENKTPQRSNWAGWTTVTLARAGRWLLNRGPFFAFGLVGPVVAHIWLRSLPVQKL